MNATRRGNAFDDPGDPHDGDDALLLIVLMVCTGFVGNERVESPIPPSNCSLV